MENARETRAWRTLRAPLLPTAAVSVACYHVGFSALIGNAQKFTDLGELVVRVEDEETEPEPLLHFLVRDTGVGIAPERVAASGSVSLGGRGDRLRAERGAHRKSRAVIG